MGRLAVALGVAGMLAVSGLGWGAVMAGKAARSEDLAQRQQQQTAGCGLNAFNDLIKSAEFD